MRLYKEFTADGSWFFKPWNKEVVTDPQTGKTYDFADAPTKLLTTVQDCWVMHPGESWHGFKDIPDNWSMLDPIKVSILAPGMGYDVVISRLNRAGVELVASGDISLQFGDILNLVGRPSAIDAVANVLGNAQQKLHRSGIPPASRGTARRR